MVNRYYRKKRPVTFRRPRKVMAPFRRYKKVQNRVSYFTRQVAFSTIIEQPLGVSNMLGYSFKLEDMPSYTEFTNLFDAYQITKIVMQFRTAFNLNTWVYGRPEMYIVHDYNDATAPSSFNSLLENTTCKIKQFGLNFNVVLYPKIAKAAYAGLITAYTQGKSGWIPTMYSDIQHYGVKIGFPTTGATANTPLYYVFLKYWIKCRDAK